MSARVFILTKDPVPGQVKTRLTPMLSPVQAQASGGWERFVVKSTRIHKQTLIGALSGSSR